MFKYLLPLALVATVATPAGAASPAGQPRSVTVAHRDLDLGTQAGRTTLDSRLEAAVRSVCREPTRDLLSKMVQRRCETASFRDAQASARLAVLRRQRDEGAELQVAAR